MQQMIHLSSVSAACPMADACTIAAALLGMCKCKSTSHCEGFHGLLRLSSAWSTELHMREQVFADSRYQRHDKRDKLPAWITSHLKDSHLNLSTSMLLHIARSFMRSMAQPYDRMQVGKSLLTAAAVAALDPALLT